MTISKRCVSSLSLVITAAPSHITAIVRESSSIQNYTHPSLDHQTVIDNIGQNATTLQMN